MADNSSNESIKDFLLTPIVAPSLEQSNYAQGISDSFRHIDENFAKLLSVPFLQGADGKDFELYKQNLFDVDNPTLQSNLNDWGRSLLYSIYKQDDNDDFNAELKSKLEADVNLEDFHQDLYDTTGNTVRGLLVKYELNKYYPVESTYNGETTLTYADETILLMPYVWTYVTRNDKDEIDSQFVAQYYRFIDARIAKFKNDNTIDYTNLFFDEMSCFLTYDPSDREENEKFGKVNIFDRIYLTPTLHYDQTTGDWTWVIDGTETGISAQGVQGNPGTPGAKCWWAVTTPLSEGEDIIDTNKKLLTITHILVPGDSEPLYGTWAEVDDSTVQSLPIQDGDLVYCMSPILVDGEDPDDWNYEDLFISTMRVDDSTETKGFKVFYNEQYSFVKYIDKLSLSDLLSKVGKHTNNDPMVSRGLWIPMNPNITEPYTVTPPVHMMYSSDNQDLRFQVSNLTTEEMSSDEISSPLARILFDNYIIHSSRLLLQTGAETTESSAEDLNNRLLAGRVLGLFGNTVGLGSFDLSGKENNENTHSINISDFDDINISSNTESINAINEYKLKVGKGEELGRYKICKQGVSYPIIEDGVVQEKSYNYRGYKEYDKYGAHIPHLSNEYLSGNEIAGERITIGLSVLIDSSIMNINSTDDISAAFKYLYRLGGSGGENTTVTGVQSFNLPSLPSSLSKTITGALKIKDYDGETQVKKSGESIISNNAQYPVETSKSGTKYTTTLRTDLITKNGLTGARNYLVIPKNSNDLNPCGTDYIRNYSSNIRDAISNYLSENILPSSSKLVSYKGTINLVYSAYPDCSGAAQQVLGLFNVTATPGLTTSSITMTYLNRSNWVSHLSDTMAGRTTTSTRTPQLAEYSGLSKLKKEIRFTGSITKNSISMNSNPSCEISTERPDSGWDYGKFQMTANGTVLNSPYKWHNVTANVGSFAIKLELLKIEVNITEYTYENNASKNKYLICPKGIFWCNATNSTDTDMWNNMKRVVWEQITKSDLTGSDSSESGTGSGSNIITSGEIEGGRIE